MKQDGFVPDSPTILVAAQGDQFRRFPHYLLRKAGYGCVEAAHGYEALYIARLYAAKLRVLVAEADLPFVTGLELASQIEAANPALKTVLLMPNQTYSVSENLALLPAASSPQAILSTVRRLLTPPRRERSSIHERATGTRSFPFFAAVRG